VIYARRSARILLLLLIALSASFTARAQAVPTPLQVTRVYGITSPLQVIDNRSILAQNNYFGFTATGTGTWSAQIQWSDTSASGPWTVFGTGDTITNASSPAIGVGYGFHKWISFAITGSGVVITYSAEKDFFVGSSGGGGGTCNNCTIANTPLTAGRLLVGAGGLNIGLGDLSGDASTAGGTVLTFATVNGAPGTCGDATHVCQVTTNAKGLVVSQAPIAISGGGGTCVLLASQLSDFNPVYSSAAGGTLTMNSNASSTTPVLVQVGTALYRGITPVSMSVTSGTTDTAYVYVNSSGTVNIGTNTAVVNCIGCTPVTGITAFPLNSKPLFTWAISGGAFTPSGDTDFRAFLYANSGSGAGSNYVVDVKATCGATGNGSTDDQPAIQSCLNGSIPANGTATVVFPPGTYKLVAGGLTVDHKNVQFSFYNGASVLAGAGFPGSTNLLNLTNGNYQMIGHGVLDNNNLAQICSFTQATDDTMTTSAFYDGMTCQNTLSVGVYTKNTVLNRPGDSHLNGVTYQNLTIKNTFGTGLLVVGGQNVKYDNIVTDNTCTGGAGLSSSGCDAVAVSSSSNGTIDNISINNNNPVPLITFNPATDFHMFGDSMFDVGHVVSKDATLPSTLTCAPGGCNIGLHCDTCYRTSIHDSTVRGNGNGARLEVSRDTQFTNNIISDRGGYGILLNTRPDSAVLSAMDTTTGFTAGANITLSIDNADKKEGAGSLVATFGGGFTTGNVWTFDMTSYAGNTAIRPQFDMWIKPSVDIGFGTLNVLVTTSFGTVATLGVPAIKAGTWTWLHLQDLQWMFHQNGTSVITSLILNGTASLGGGATVKGDLLVNTVPYDNVDVSNNKLARIRGDGIQIQGGSTNFSVNNNTVENVCYQTLNPLDQCASINYGPFNAGEVSWSTSIVGNTLTQDPGGLLNVIGLKVQGHNGALLVGRNIHDNDVNGMDSPTSINPPDSDVGTPFEGTGTSYDFNCSRSNTDGNTNCDSNVGNLNFNTAYRFGRNMNLGTGTFSLQILDNNNTNAQAHNFASLGVSCIGCDGDVGKSLAVMDNRCSTNIIFCVGYPTLTQKVTVDNTGNLTGNSLKLFGSMTAQGGAVNLNHPATADPVTGNSLPSPLLFSNSLWDGAAPQNRAWKFAETATAVGVPTFDNMVISAPVAVGSYAHQLIFAAENTAASGNNFNSMTLNLQGQYGTAQVINWKIVNIVDPTGATPNSTLSIAPGSAPGTTSIALVAPVTVQSIAINGQPVMSNPPVMTWTTYNACQFNVTCNIGAQWFPSYGITVDQWRITVQTHPDVTCTTFPVIGLKQGATDLATITLDSTNFDYSAAVTANVAAGSAMRVYIKTAGIGCATFGSNTSSMVEYKMQ
jgi:hypothetical protein